MKPLLYELHGQYLENKQAIAFSNVMEYINELPTPRLYFAISKYNKELKEKNTKVLVEQIIIDTVDDMVDNIEPEEPDESKEPDETTIENP
mgnify:FL=1